MPDRIAAEGIGFSLADCPVSYRPRVRDVGAIGSRLLIILSTLYFRRKGFKRDPSCRTGEVARFPGETAEPVPWPTDMADRPTPIPHRPGVSLHRPAAGFPLSI
jgi:hypothetical protein